MNRWVQGPIRTAATWGIIIESNKYYLRKNLRKQRQSLSSSKQGATSKKITEQISTRLFFEQALKLAFYLPFDGEVNPMDLCSLAHHLGKKCYLPQITGETLTFRQFIPNNTELQKNGYNILEPCSTESIPVETLDVVFMPLVAFDKHGNRLGMGKGYYDHTFSERSKWNKKPLLIGIAHSFQEAKLEPHSKDVPMDGIATEFGIICCQENSHKTR